MKAIIVSILLGLVSLTAFSQSKLAGAGKASKVGGTTVTQKKSSSTKSSETRKSVSDKTTPLKRSVDSKYESSAYMEITGVKFGNEDNEGHVIDKYGTKLYASEVKYLKPQLLYKGLSSSEKDVTLYVKILKEDGSLEKGSSSPEGYTYKQDFTVKPGANQTVLLLGWGRNSGGSFSPGQYTFEIWYKDNMLYQKEIRLYSGTTPIVPNNILSISRISFANTDKDGKIISDYGQTLYDGKVQYLKPKIYYNGKYSSNQDVVLYVRYFKSSGGLVAGTSSPIGFSYKESVTIKPGSNSLTLSGFGNETATNYKEGTCKVEIWIDGEKLYETNVTISKFGTSSDSRGRASSSINDFFPMWGYTLGQTTWEQAESLGHNVKEGSGGGHYVRVRGVYFWDHNNVGHFTSIYWTQSDNEFPALWKNKGFSWDNSYNSWLSIFKNLGFKVEITKEPTNKEYSGRTTLSADVKATSPDGILEFALDFDYGENGYYTSSPKTLYSIRVRYLGN